MHGKFNIALSFENENTGEILRNFKADIYLDTLDDCSIDYLKGCIVEACEGAINIVKDI